MDTYTLPNTLSVRFGGFTGPELLSMVADDVEVDHLNFFIVIFEAEMARSFPYF